MSAETATVSKNIAPDSTESDQIPLFDIAYRRSNSTLSASPSDVTFKLFQIKCSSVSASSIYGLNNSLDTVEMLPCESLENIVNAFWMDIVLLSKKRTNIFVLFSGFFVFIVDCPNIARNTTNHFYSIFIKSGFALSRATSEKTTLVSIPHIILMSADVQVVRINVEFDVESVKNMEILWNWFDKDFVRSTMCAIVPTVCSENSITVMSSSSPYPWHAGRWRLAWHKVTKRFFHSSSPMFHHFNIITFSRKK